LRDIRHALEYRYLKLSYEWWSGFGAVRSELLSRLEPGTTRPEALDELDDNLALYQGRPEFDTKALHMFQMVRAAPIYLSLAIHWEEGRRSRERDADTPVPSIEAPIFSDELKF
jgi:hypothetical protein